MNHNHHHGPVFPMAKPGSRMGRDGLELLPSQQTPLLLHTCGPLANKTEIQTTVTVYHDTTMSKRPAMPARKATKDQNLATQDAVKTDSTQPNDGESVKVSKLGKRGNHNTDTAKQQRLKTGKQGNTPLTHQGGNTVRKCRETTQPSKKESLLKTKLPGTTQA